MKNIDVLLILLQVLSSSEAYSLKCPTQAQWELRAKSMCMPPRNYTCLFDVTFRVNVYKDKCNSPRILAPGYKYVFQPNLNRATCSSTRFQPFIFDTIGRSDCTFLKSFCSSEGQMTFTTGNTTSDRRCICNINEAYTFVTETNKQCSCNPSNEDCSCYIDMNHNNSTIGSKDLKCYKDINVTSSRSQGDVLIKSKNFDDFKYNLVIPTSKYRITAIACIFILLSSYILVAVGLFILHRIIRKGITPKQFDIVECSDYSLTVKWYISGLDNYLEYTLAYRLEGSDDWTRMNLSTVDVLTEENRCRVYTLKALSPDTIYEFKIRCMNCLVKSGYTNSITKRTLQNFLPEAILRLSEEDRIRYNDIMQSSKTEKRHFIRVMIVGKNSAGKTCLMRRLLKEGIGDVCSTDGVDIVVRRCKINIDNGEWTIEKEIEDDKIDRIKRAVIQNERMKLETTEGNQSENGYIDIQDDKSKDKMYDSQYDFTSAENNETKHFLNQKDATSNVVLPNCEYLDSGDVENPDSPYVSNTNAQIETKMNEDSMEERISDHRDKLSILANSIQNVNENKIEPSTLIMPSDLMSHVFSKSTTNSSSNRYALCELWDFAGQKEFYATHQAFLTNSAVYLVVADMTDDIKKQGISQCFADFQDVGEYVDFWFNSIHCHRTTDDTVNDYFDPPILLVFTGKDKYDQTQFENRKKELDRHLDNILGRQSKYHHLREKFYLSNTNDCDDEFERVRNAIYENAKKMDNWGKPFPLKWIFYEHLIAINKDNGKNFTNYNDMVQMAKHKEINIHKPEDILLFLRFQHNVGNIIFFETIKDLIILKPQWLADAFRCLVSDNVDNSLHHLEDWTELKEHGKISEYLITKLFESKSGCQFSGQKVNLHKIMEDLDILVKIESTHTYIMPSEIPPCTLDNVCSLVGIENCRRTSWLCLKFDFLPPCFFHHLSAWLIRKYKPCKLDKISSALALYRGICIFDIDSNGCQKLLITMSSDTIALQILSFFSQEKELGIMCTEVLNELEEKVKAIKDRYQLQLSLNLHFNCSKGNYYKDTMSYQDLKKTKEYYCTQCRKAHISAELYMPWLKSEEDQGTDYVLPFQTLNVFNVLDSVRENQSNHFCADCRAPDAHWASINIGIVLCKNCAGIHRDFDHRISCIKSLRMDTTIWTPSLIELMKAVGNENANKFWESRLLAIHGINTESSPIKRKQFIQDKYERKLWIDLHPLIGSLNKELLRVVVTEDILQTMRIVFSGADILFTDSSTGKTAFDLARNEGQRLQTEFLYHNGGDRTSRASADIDEALALRLRAEITMEGHLLKTGPRNRNAFMDRYCVIEHGCLHYFFNEKSSTARDSIDNESMFCVQAVTNVEKYPNAFELSTTKTSNRTYLFAAKTQKEKMTWMRTLTKLFCPIHFIKEIHDKEFSLAGNFYMKAGVASEWQKTWILVNRKIVRYLDDEQKLLEIDLRKVSNIQYVEHVAGQPYPYSAESGKFFTIDIPGKSLYFQADLQRDTERLYEAFGHSMTGGGPTIEDQQLTPENVPVIVHKCIKFIEDNGFKDDGVYRLAAQDSKIQNVLSQFLADAHSLSLRLDLHSVNEVANCLKRFFRQLKDPLFTKIAYQNWIKCAAMESVESKLSFYKFQINQLPLVNKCTVKKLILHLASLSTYSAENKMDVKNIALAFASTLMKRGAEMIAQNHLPLEMRVIEDLITHHSVLFEKEKTAEQQLEEEHKRILFRIKQMSFEKPVEFSQIGEMMVTIFYQHITNQSEIYSAKRGGSVGEAVEHMMRKFRLSLGQWVLYEVVYSDVLERPLHPSECLLDVVMSWSNWEEEYRKNTHLVMKSAERLLQLDEVYDPNHALFAEFKYKEKKEKFKKFSFGFNQSKLSLFKDLGYNTMPLKSWKIEDMLIYFGADPKKNAHKFAFSFFIKGEKIGKGDMPLFGRTICCTTHYELVIWMAALLKAKHPNGFLS